MGELDVVITVLKVLGKIIDKSGLDLSIEEAKIYGAATICQIKEGKQLHHSLEAHFVIYLALYQKYCTKLLENYPEIYDHLKELVLSNTSSS